MRAVQLQQHKACSSMQRGLAPQLAAGPWSACRQQWQHAHACETLAANTSFGLPLAALPYAVRAAGVAGRSSSWSNGSFRLPRVASWHVCMAAAAGGAQPVAAVGVEDARRLLDGPTVVLDIRSEREYDDGHITKPARKCAHAPFATQDGSQFVAQVSAMFPNRAAKLMLMCADGGQHSSQAASLLLAAGFSDVTLVQGGYAAYTAVWSPSGKRRPPSGRWISTGKEALKSGLNIPGVAESYDEGGNLISARWAKGLEPGQSLPDSR